MRLPAKGIRRAAGQGEFMDSALPPRHKGAGTQRLGYNL